MTTPAPGWPVADAARRVGVSVSTLHSWQRRYGLAPSGRTAGGHRRYTAEDVARLQRLRSYVGEGMPTAEAAGRVRTMSGDAAPRPLPPGAGHRLLAAAERLDPTAVGRGARAVLHEHGTVDGWTQVFVPALQEAGARWEHTGRGVECEHVLTAGIRTALERRAERGRPPSAPTVLLAATPGEEHTLPLNAAAAALAERGTASRVLGTLPAVALFDAVARSAPAAVVLWARTPGTAEAGLLADLAGRAPLVFAAGPGWPARPGAVPALADLATTVERVTGWLG
jgi:DNA-binding transcriptional MerR regulator